MDTRIVTDCKAMAERIRVSLTLHGVECREQAITTLDGTSVPHFSFLSGFNGLLFLGFSHFENNHIPLLRQLKLLVAPEAKLVIVAMGADHDAILSIVRAGANDILSGGDELGQEIGCFLARVSQEDRFKVAHGHVLTVVPCHSSIDASVLATNMAAVLAESSQPCGLLDFHFRGGDLALLLTLEPRHTITDLLNQSEPIDEAMFSQAITSHESGIQLLAGPSTFGGTTNVSLQSCQQIIALARARWPMVVINLEDVQHAEQVHATVNSDSVILAMRLNIVSLHNAQQHLDFLVKSQIPKEHIHLVALETGCSGELPLSAVKKVLHTNNIYCIPDDPVAMLTSVNIGNPLVIEHPHSKPSIAIRQFVREITRTSSPVSVSPKSSAGAWSVASKLTSQLLPLVGKLPSTPMR